MNDVVNEVWGNFVCVVDIILGDCHSTTHPMNKYPLNAYDVSGTGETVLSNYPPKSRTTFMGLIF
jgi:hypothetical protein